MSTAIYQNFNKKKKRNNPFTENDGKATTNDPRNIFRRHSELVSESSERESRLGWTLK
ncbi:hypothetical protein [Candidatus Avelusimicrobium sp.]|uniref:hypothetical protein n=1 Tax=Candidatus Avelusimicrobium sp. TaxID=3048833 RepID=UPI003D7C572C